MSKVIFFITVYLLCWLGLVRTKNVCSDENNKNKILADPNDIQKFIRCGGLGELLSLSCPTNLIWDPETNTCKNQKNVDESKVYQRALNRLEDTSNSTIIKGISNSKKLPSIPLTQTEVEVAHGFIPLMSRLKLILDRVKNPVVFDNEKCNQVRINDTLPILNGLYTKIESGLYKKANFIKTPGLIATIGDKWCISFEFSLVPSESLNLKHVVESCGTSLKCCLFISNSTQMFSLSNPRRLWINMHTNEIQNMDIGCDAQDTDCEEVSICPPECLVKRNRCDVCECNGGGFNFNHTLAQGAFQESLNRTFLNNQIFMRNNNTDKTGSLLTKLVPNFQFNNLNLFFLN